MRDASDSASAPAPAPARLRSQATATRKVAPATIPAAERLLPNGDLYSGSFAGTVPHGTGKYLWSDGCMYEGEWRRGKAAGKGKFSWPSGATYEGEFKAGRMDGYGTFTGSEGDTYRGTWSADRKHGFGEKSYANGDLYVGFWRRNVQDGQGRYVWRNGNEYVGHWRNGVISGNGVLIWANGDRFEGQWINGVPKAKNGEFTRDDFKDGVRRSGLEDRSRKRCSVDGRRSLGVERSFPRICIWESDGEAGDITCDIIDNVEASMFYRGGDGGTAAALRPMPPRSSRCWFMGEDVKKPGETISKGHKNYDLMLNLQLGIRYCVGKPGWMRDLRMSDFDPREKFWTRFPPEGSKLTPPHQSVEFRWKDYCPNVFRHLRELFAIDPADYMLAICGDDALRELSSPGKSGSIFYMTQDDRFMIKTVKKSEVKVLLRMLPSYFQHVRQYENSLVTKFFGVHCVKPLGGQKVRFIIMGNLFCSEYRIHRRFDLKGSSHGRTTDKSEGEIDETTTLKDLDLNFVFHLQRSWFEDLLRQIDQDCEFLEAERIMDYSLLVGLHFLDDQSIDKIGLSPHVARPSQRESFQGESGISRFHFLEVEGPDIDRILTRWNPSIRLGANMPARAEQLVKSDSDQCQSTGGESTPARSGDFHEVILYFGIIDILQDYDISKKLEHAYKSLQANPTSISAVDPKLYSKRFRDFVRRIFIEDR